jgi:hypothetical protein
MEVVWLQAAPDGSRVVESRSGWERRRWKLSEIEATSVEPARDEADTIKGHLDARTFNLKKLNRLFNPAKRPHSSHEQNDPTTRDALQAQGF